MAINKKLIHFQTLANFEAQLSAGNILDTSICFIKDAKKIWTHGEFYDCSEGGSSVDLSDYYTKAEIENKGYATQTYVTNAIANAITTTLNTAV